MGSIFTAGYQSAEILGEEETLVSGVQCMLSMDLWLPLFPEL